MTLILSGSDGVTFPDSTEQETGYANGIGFRNRIINGDMRIDQRNAGASVTPTNGQYLLDRWSAINGGVSSKFSVQQNAGSVTPPTGFTNYLGVTSLSAYSILTSDRFYISQAIEGLNVADLAWGTAGAKTITVSFQVYSSLTGTFGGAIQNNAQNRSYPFTYTISTADTWEQKTVTISGDTSGTWLTTNGPGLLLYFGLGVGSTVSGTAGAWAGADYRSATGATSVVGTNGATFYITGVQLEVGSVATPFERRPFGTELALCQRYYQQIGKTNNVSYQAYSMGACSLTTNAVHILQLPVTMRASPTFTFNDATNTFVGVVGTAATAVAVDISSPITIMYNVTVASGLTVGQASRHYQNATSASSLELSAEL